ncbi:thioesterase family protein [Nocardioides panacisoli]|uniref:acyl-CoA thioesterase n=1 Tax=Nocardioides panacisoli TaxID=627624 RepID=UPI0031D1B4CE
MRHRYVCPLRWADLDLLGHVNNVRYVDYLQEARLDLLRAHREASGATGPGDDPADGIIVIRHEVTYLAPLGFRLRPVLIECWVTRVRHGSFSMSYEVFHEAADGTRTVYLRATTLLAPYRLDEERPRRLSEEERAALSAYVEPADPVERPEPFRVARTPEGHYPVHVRFSDVDVYRHVNNVVYFEYFQEARIRLFSALGRGLTDVPPIQVVVAQADVDYLAPILLRAEPYDCWTQIARVGNRSLTVESEILDDERVLARARVALVFFDGASQRAVEPPAAYRERLLSAVPGAGEASSAPAGRP